MDGRLLAELYEKYSKEILLYVYSLCHDRHVAEDIMQDVFTKAILSLQSNHTNIRAWLYKVARNITYNSLRKDVNKAKAFEKLKAVNFMEEDIAAKVVLNEQYKDLYSAISHLSSKYREVLIMQYFSNMQLKEIAVVLGITPENARILSYRAKKKLREYLEDRNELS